MQKIIKIIFYITILIGSASLNGYAQNNSPIHLGTAILYSPEFETVGLKVTSLFEITPEVSFAVNFTNYSNTASGGLNSARGLNINTHYKILDEGEFNIYTFAGGKVYQNKFANASSNTDYGLNIGVGLNYAIQKISLFSDAKYIIQSRNNLAFGVGVRYRIN